MSLSEIQKERNEQCRERHELAVNRIRSMVTEETVEKAYVGYFQDVALFLLELENTRRKVASGEWENYTLEQMRSLNEILYSDILDKNYERSYANPEYAVSSFGTEMGQLLSLLYAELRGGIPYAFEEKTDYLTILYELFIEVYNCFENAALEEASEQSTADEKESGAAGAEKQIPSAEQIREILYWYASDYCDVFLADRIREQVLPEESFATDLIMNSDLTDLRYLYQFGEYISENEWKTAEHLNSLPEETIRKMADVYTEGYRIGFVNTGKDLSKKSVVNIRYILGFERVVKKAIENFEKMGLKPVIYRAAVSVLTKRQHIKIGYYGAVANKQYEYDHKDDQALFMDKKYLERKLEVMQTTYEHHKKEAAGFAGPACIDMFGEEPFEPEAKETVAKLSKSQEEMILQYDSRQSQMVNQYIKGEERSFTIIAYPVPEIGEKYEEIFDEIIRINTLDAKLYEKVQQTLIDALDQGEYVHILGTNGNRTDLNVQLHPLNDPKKETIFENCVADVNIPVGEVFTSPVLEGTNGVLHVSKVYLNELQYRDLEITFSNGMVSEYNCANFERELENKAYIHDNVLYKHPTLPLGEFAIGTNTTAYVTAKKYGIEDKMPILIAEKMGPHFAVGDTCYSWCEDIKVYNPNGKEIIARDNSVSIRRKEDVSKAYFHCHTDITIPYEELGSITVVTKDKKEIVLLENGKFVLPGTEILNEPLKNSNK